MLITVGFMSVAVALVIGAANAQTAELYFGQSELVRETTLMPQRAALESTGLRLPHFKSLGIGLRLGGIVMALRVIIDNLKAVGVEVLSSLPDGQRPRLPAPPWFAALMSALMTLGLVILIVVLVIALGLAGAARQLFAQPLPEDRRGRSRLGTAGAAGGGQLVHRPAQPAAHGRDGLPVHGHPTGALRTQAAMLARIRGG